MRAKTILILLLLITCRLSAQKGISISGCLTGANGLNISLFLIEDPLTRNERLIATETIDPKGDFSFHFDTTGVQTVVLEVMLQRDEFTVVPGQPLKLTGNFNKQIQGVEAWALNQPIGLWPIQDDSLFFDKPIRDFEQRYAAFLDTAFRKIYRQRDYTPALRFINQQKGEQTYDTISYRGLYIHHRLGTLAYTSGIWNRTDALKSLFSERPKLDNPGWWDLFRLLFDNYLTISSNNYFSQKAINLALSQPDNLTALDDTLGKDPFLKDEIVRELVILLSAKEQINGVQSSNWERILTQLSSTSDFTSHRRLALNILKSSSRVKQGSLAPSPIPGFNSFPDSLLGKPVYLIFNHQLCNTCQTQSLYMTEWQKKSYWPGRIIIVDLDITADPKMQIQTQQVIRVNGGRDPQFIKQWQIKSLPLYAIIDSEGRIVQFPAPEPGPDLENKLETLTRPKEPRRRTFR